MSGCLTNFIHILTFGIIPLCLNISQLIFIAFCYDPSQKMSSATNIIFIITIIFFYFEGSVTVFIYNLAIDGWSRRLNNDLSAKILICLLHPFYYLVTLPMSMKSIIHSIGTPKNLWNRCFLYGCCQNHEEWTISKETTHTVDANGMCCITWRGFCIIIPFSLFFLLYCVFILILSPLVWFFLSAIGFGPLGVCMHLCLQDELGFSESLFYSIDVAGSLSTSFFALINATISFIICTVYVCTVNANWPVILFFCFAGLTYLAAIPSFFDICTNGSAALNRNSHPRKQPPPVISAEKSEATISSNETMNSSRVSNTSEKTQQSD